MMGKGGSTKHILISSLSIILVIVMCFAGIGCGNEYGDLYNKYPSPNPNAYTNDTDSVPVTGGGSLKAFVERQKEGKLSGDTLSVRYFLRNTYTGNKSVEEIRATWNISAQFRRKTDSSFTASIGVGTDIVQFGVGGSSSVEYQDKTVTKYFKNTNGVKEVYYGASNYTLYPYTQLNSQSLTNNAYLKIKAHATPYSITAAV